MIGIEHIGICAQDTTMLKDWYVRLFNLKVVYDNKKERPTYFLLMEDNSMIEIYACDSKTESTDNMHQGIRHIAFSTDCIEKNVEILKKNNVEIINELKESKGNKTIFFKDPEGNIIHFIQREKNLY